MTRQKHQCSICHGTGRSLNTVFAYICKECKGTGNVNYREVITEKIVHPCDECDGTGKRADEKNCRHCYGTGNGWTQVKSEKVYD